MAPRGPADGDAKPAGQQVAADAARVQDEDTLEREQAESLTRIERGRIPLGAERRLERMAREGGVFTSDLSVPEFMLGNQLGLQPLTQVMGSCVYQVGWQYAREAIYTRGRPVLQELETISEAWNEARGRAVKRMRQEAVLAEADAVVGVHATSGRYDWAESSVEFAVFGTAVRDPSVARHGEAVLTDLSLQDYWKLRQAGLEPCGLVAATSCFFVVRGAWAAQMQTLTFTRNQEITDYTQGVYQARETALERLTDQIHAVGGDGVVGVKITHTIGEHEMKTGMGGSTVRGLIVTFHAVGTAIRMGQDAPIYPPETTMSLTK